MNVWAKILYSEKRHLKLKLWQSFWVKFNNKNIIFCQILRVNFSNNILRIPGAPLPPRIYYTTAIDVRTLIIYEYTETYYNKFQSFTSCNKRGNNFFLLFFFLCPFRFFFFESFSFDLYWTYYMFLYMKLVVMKSDKPPVRKRSKVSNSKWIKY